MASCRARNSAGEPCGSPPLTGEDWCIHHHPDPEIQAEMARRRKKGGHTSGGHNRRKMRTVSLSDCPPKPETIADVAAWLSWAIVACATGQLDARTAKEVGSLLRYLRETLEKTELDEKVRELEEQLRALQKGAGLKAV